MRRKAPSSDPSLSFRSGAGEEDSPVFSVSQITESIANLLKLEFGKVSVEGEISGLKVASSGHVYFSLKDESALLKAVLWKSRKERLSFLPMDGQLVRATGSITVYPPRGEYQLDVLSLAQAGIGLLQKKFEELKKRLAAEGLFDASRKRIPPPFFRNVVVITSAGGAALQDFLKTLSLSRQAISILVIPCRVQGVEAPAEIVHALQIAPKFSPDLVVVTRGGGSLEDLWAFNEEMVARAIAACPVPVLSAVGHEVDFTIADFVADLRTATPTAAAQYIAGCQQVIRDEVEDLENRLITLFEEVLQDYRIALDALTGRIHSRSPLTLIPFYRQRLDDLLHRGQSFLHRDLQKLTSEVHRITLSLAHSLKMDLVIWRGKVLSSQARLQVLDPRATLQRGYTLCETSEDQRLIRNQIDFPQDAQVRVHFHDGMVKVRWISGGGGTHSIASSIHRVPS